jgi:hypothetical protein
LLTKQAQRNADATIEAGGVIRIMVGKLTAAAKR